MKNRSDLNQSYAAFDQASTIVSVVELSSKNWLAAATVPGVKRQPRKNLSCNPHGLLPQIERWRAEAGKAGHELKRIGVAFGARRHHQAGQGGAEACGPAHAERRADPAQHAGAALSRPGTARRHPEADQGDRAGTAAAAEGEADARNQSAGPDAGEDLRPWPGDG